MTEHEFVGLEEQMKDERGKVDVAAVSFSVRELVRMYEDGELSIAPAYQRKYRWPVKVASTFIESVFLGLPIPPLFVATNADFEWEVVDGLQRISTLILFLSKSEDSRHAIRPEAAPLALQGLEKLTQLNGKSYADLPASIQRYFSRQPLQVVSLTDKSNKAVRFDLFERLNSGAVSLTPQEVRTAVYGGEFLDFAERLAEYPSFKSLLKLQELHQHDGTSAEQVIKFFAYKNDQENFTGAVTRFINNYSEKATTSFSYATEEKVFKETFDFLYDTIGGPFLRPTTPVTPLVHFEACGVAIARLIQEGTQPKKPAADWLEDEELVKSSTGGTNTRSMLNRRISRAKDIFRTGS